MKKTHGCLGYVIGMILPSYVGIIINHCEDPYQPTSIMESERFFFVAHLVPGSFAYTKTEFSVRFLPWVFV